MKANASNCLPAGRTQGEKQMTTEIATFGAEVLYPRRAGAEATWDPGPGVLTVTLPRHPSACVLRLT